MPVYEYIENGRPVLRRLPVADRDKFPGRVTIPSRLSVCPRGEPTQGEQVLNGWRKCEEKMGTAKVRAAEKALGLNHHGVKNAWNDPN